MIIQLDRTAFKRRLWQRAYQRKLKQICDENCSLPSEQQLEQLIFYGIKCYGKWFEKPENSVPWVAYQEIHSILDLMKHITPRQLMTMFPIDKDFDGHKYECKDYFYTNEFLSTIDMDQPIEEPFEFLWDYWNNETSCFLLNVMQAMSDIRKEQVGKGIMEEFLENEGFEFL